MKSLFIHLIRFEIFGCWNLNLNGSKVNCVYADECLKLKVILERWQSFEDGLEQRNVWFRQQESVFGDQQLHISLDDKEAQLNVFVQIRDTITSYEPEIDAFIDEATALFQSSGVERLRPLINQMSSKYQQLHVRSMEVVSKWHGIVDDHRLYEDKFMETLAWITSLEDTLNSIL